MTHRFSWVSLFLLFVTGSVDSGSADELELWLGKVEYAQLREAKNDQGEPELVIEWLAQRYQPLEEINTDALSDSDIQIKAIPIKNEYFVSTLRTRDMPRELALELVSDANDTNPTVVRFAVRQYVGTMNKRSAVFIGGGSGGIYTNKIVEGEVE